jgi:hypothetical protein
MRRDCKSKGIIGKSFIIQGSLRSSGYIDIFISEGYILRNTSPDRGFTP